MRLVAGLGVVAAVAAWGLKGTVWAEEIEPTWGRVLGVYCQHATNSGEPQFPFYSQIQINSEATSTSASAATPDTSLIAADELATLPSDAFAYTGYVSKEADDQYSTFTTPAVFTPGATYRMNVYVTEPYASRTRSQYVEVNGARIQDAQGNDFWYYPSDINLSGTHAAKKVWKFVVSNVVAKANGTISWAFPRKTNKSAMNVITFDGTSQPSKPVLSTGQNGSTVLLSWTKCTDALAYHVERKGTSGDWTKLAQTHETSYVDSDVAENTYSYRIVASNGVGVAVSEASEVGTRQSLYALHLGPPGYVAGRFVSALPFLTGNFKSRSLAESPVGMPLDLEGSEDVMKYYGYVFSQLTFTFSNLTANATYNLRYWTMETYSNMKTMANADSYRRVAIGVNGTQVTNNISAWTLSGHTLYKPVPIDFQGTTDADGVLAVQFSNNSDFGIVLGLELFALGSGGLTTAPPLRAFGVKEGVRLVAEFRSAALKYDFQYRDSPDAEPTMFLQQVPGWSVFDATIPVGQTRAYRARVNTGTQCGPWSDWVSAARGERSPYVPLRVNHTWNTSVRQNPPEGWVDGDPFRTSVHETSKINGATFPTTEFDVSQVEDPAPQDVYRTQFYTSDNKDYTFVFPGFDPACEYLVRVHMAESWTEAKAGTRTCGLAVGQGVPLNFEQLDVFVAAGSKHNTAVVWELPTRPHLDGTIRLDVLHAQQNATVRGTEIIPLGAAANFDGQVKAAWSAHASKTTGIDEACVAETAQAGWSWTSADLPAACAGTRTRLMARGLVSVPVVGVYTFKTTANGLVRLWLDGTTNLLDRTTTVAAGAVAATEVPLSAGAHELVLEYLQAADADFAVSVDWESPVGNLGDLMAYTSSVAASPRLPAGWKSVGMGNRAISSYVFCTDADVPTYRISGSGSDMWGGSCDGTFLYRELKGTFEVKMRLVDRGGIYAANTRYGLAVRSTLGTLGASDFMLYAGVNGDKDGSAVLKGYEDVDGKAGTSMVGWDSNSVPAAKPNFPLWMKFTRDYCPTGGHRYVCSFSNDNETWYFARTQDVARVQTVYVGPWVTGHHTVSGTLAWMDVDNLTVTDTTPRGTVVFFR